MGATTPFLPRTSAERITVGLTRRNSEELAKLTEESGMSKTDLINRAIGLYALMVEKTDAGFNLGFIGPEDDTGTPVIEVVHIL